MINCRKQERKKNLFTRVYNRATIKFYSLCSLNDDILLVVEDNSTIVELPQPSRVF